MGRGDGMRGSERGKRRGEERGGRERKGEGRRGVTITVRVSEERTQGMEKGTITWAKIYLNIASSIFIISGELDFNCQEAEIVYLAYICI